MRAQGLTSRWAVRSSDDVGGRTALTTGTQPLNLGTSSGRYRRLVAEEAHRASSTIVRAAIAATSALAAAMMTHA
jgi:hypothetical protein